MDRCFFESDWKLFRQQRALALQRFSQGILDEIVQIAVDVSWTPHDRYLKIFQVIRERDRTMADNFDNPRRSNALNQLLSIYSLGLLTDAEIEDYSLGAKEVIRRAAMKSA